jgi:hypothetical protein
LLIKNMSSNIDDNKDVEVLLLLLFSTFILVIYRHSSII